MIRLHPLSKPIDATVEIPGSKSYTNRALVLAAMTEGVVKLEKPLLSDDTEAMMSCLATLGIRCEREGDTIIVHGGISHVQDKEYVLDANLSGTTIRFLTAFAAFTPGTKVLTGGHGLLKRPIKDLVDSLRALGVEISYVGQENCPPLRIVGKPKEYLRRIGPGGIPSVSVNGGISSQFLSALLLSAPLCDGLILEIEGDLISKPYAAMTVGIMREFGVNVESAPHRYSVPRGETYHRDTYQIQGDYSAAGYFAAIAALTRSRIRMKNLDPHSQQGDAQFLFHLAEMGNLLTFENDSVILEGTGVVAGTYEMESCPDQAQTLAVLLAFANGKSVLTGVRSLRVKETERVKALEAELAKMGIKTESTEDTLTIYGGNPQAAIIDTYGDHRMAMSFAVAGTVLSGMQINNPDVVSKTFPTFWEKLATIGVGVESEGESSDSKGDTLRSPKVSPLSSRSSDSKNL